jgi:hypothetical protein
MFSNVATSHLVGDALIAERTEKPIRNSRCVVISDGLNDTGFPSVSPDVIEKCQRSRQATDPSDQIDRAIILLGNNVGGASQTCGRLSRQLVSWDQSQIRDTNLRWASLSPSMYLCVV